MITIKRFVKPGLVLLYLLVFLEGVYMTSFFAIYLFSTYVPIQFLAEKYPAFSWLTDFYLSHFINWSGGSNAVTAKFSSLPFNPFRLNIFDRRNYFWFIGFFLFYAGAVPIYYGKITRRPAVSGGMYRFIRNPQYLGFAIIGIPFLVIWPRFLILMAYVSMLFSYYLLARREEKLCIEKFGPSFQAYLDRTPSMFVPGDRWLVRKLQASYRVVSNNGKLRVPVLVAVYLLIAVGAVNLAYGFKHRAVRLLPQTSTENSLAIAIQNNDRGRLADLVALAEEDPRVHDAVAQSRAQGFGFSLMYLVSDDNYGMHFLLDHFAHTRPAESWLGYRTTAYDVDPNIEEIPRDQLRSLLIWSLRSPENLSPQEVLDRFQKIHPVVMVGIDLRGPKVVGVVRLKELDRAVDPLRGSRMPLF